MAIAEQLQEFCGERRRDLVRFANLQLRDEALAEDVVQETLLAALQGSDAFSGRSSVKTWVYSILKHKIVDTLRSRRREVTLSDMANADDEGFETLFDRRGHCRTTSGILRGATPRPRALCDPAVA